MRLFKPRCPINANERLWIDESMAWFVDQFGDTLLRRAVILPTPEFFPGPCGDTEEDVRSLVTLMCRYMEIAPDRIEVEVPTTAELTDPLPYIEQKSSGVAGDYRTRDGKALISITLSYTESPVRLIATIAHELAHERLIGEGRVAASRVDHEPLTDLLTVYLGLGIFTANAAFEFGQSRYGWRAARLGYLTELMFGYALARYATMRSEAEPAWAQFLDINPHVYLKKSLRYLRAEQAR